MMIWVGSLEEKKIMSATNKNGQIIILNGTPRSGKSSIVTIIQETFEGVWMNLGVDAFMKMTPKRYQPGIGLRPGGEKPELEPLIVLMYKALYESIASHSRLGINVVVDIGHHDEYSVPQHILVNSARILSELPVLFVGVHCPIEEIMKRRIETWKVGYTEDGSIPEPIKRWQQSVHVPGIYDLEVDTAINSAEECADLIQEYLEKEKPMTAFKRIRDTVK